MSHTLLFLCVLQFLFESTHFFVIYCSNSGLFLFFWGLLDCFLKSLSRFVLWNLFTPWYADVSVQVFQSYVYFLGWLPRYCLTKSLVNTLSRSFAQTPWTCKVPPNSVNLSLCGLRNEFKRVACSHVSVSSLFCWVPLDLSCICTGFESANACVRSLSQHFYDSLILP